MIRLARRVLCCMMIASFVWCASLVADRTNPNAEKEFFCAMQTELENLQDLKSGKRYLWENLPKLWNVMNQITAFVGMDNEVTRCFARDVLNYLAGG